MSTSPVEIVSVANRILATRLHGTSPSQVEPAPLGCGLLSVNEARAGHIGVVHDDRRVILGAALSKVTTLSFEVPAVGAIVRVRRAAVPYRHPGEGLGEPDPEKDREVPDLA